MMIHFIRPYWLFLLMPAIIYLSWVLYSSRQSNPWLKVCDPHLLPALLQPGSHSSRRFFHLSLFLLFVISIVALAGPAWHKTRLPIYRDIASVMLVLDLSSNMQLTDLQPDRLSRAKFKIRDLINSAPNTQMGLVVFSGEAFTAAPLSQDASTLNAMLDELQPDMMPVRGSDVSSGLTQAVDLLKQTGTSHATVLLITGTEPDSASWSAARAIMQSGNHLSVLAMIEPNNASQSVINSLSNLAKAGGGSLNVFTPGTSDIQAIISSISAKEFIKDENVEDAYVWQDAGPWLCLLLIPFALVILREKNRHEKKI